MQNQWKIEVRGPKIEVRRGPGGVWDGSWALLRVCITFIDFRGGSWVRLVGQKTPTWPQLGPQDGAKIAQKSIQKSIKKLMHLGIAFWADLGGFWEAKWSQVGTKIASEMRFPENMKKSYLEPAR